MSGNIGGNQPYSILEAGPRNQIQLGFNSHCTTHCCVILCNPGEDPRGLLQRAVRRQIGNHYKGFGTVLAQGKYSINSINPSATQEIDERLKSTLSVVSHITSYFVLIKTPRVKQIAFDFETFVLLAPANVFLSPN